MDTNLIQPLSYTILSLFQTSLEPFLLFQKLQAASVRLQHRLNCWRVISDHL